MAYLEESKSNGDNGESENRNKGNGNGNGEGNGAGVALFETALANMAKGGALDAKKFDNIESAALLMVLRQDQLRVCERVSALENRMKELEAKA